MDLANNERIKRLNELIHEETDRDKVLELTRDLIQVVIMTLGVAMPVQLDHDGEWRANVLFDAARPHDAVVLLCN